MSDDPRRRYLSIPEYRTHDGCTHPVHAHNQRGCLVHGCRCLTPRRDLAGRSGLREGVDWLLRAIGALWLLGHTWDLLRWFLGGG